MSKLARFPLLAVLLLIPFHTMLVAHILPARLDVPPMALALWKESLLLLTLCCGTMVTLAHRRVPAFTGVDTSVLAFVAYALLSLPFSPSPLAALYGIRNYSEAFIALLLASRFAQLGEQGIWRLSRLLLAVAFFISVWAIFQSTYLGPAFLLANGYAQDGRLPTAFTGDFPFQRAVGTFESPNVFALYLTTILLVVNTVGKAQGARGIIWDAAQVTLGAALLATASRSAALGLGVGLAARRLISPEPRGYGRPHARLLLLVGASALLLVVAASSSYVAVLPKHLYRTFTLDDPSAAARVTSLRDSLNVLREHPFGVGIGQAGPRAVTYTGRLLNAESSYLIVALDMGIFGLAAYLSIWITIAAALRQAYAGCLRLGLRTRAEFCRGAFAAVCGAATACLFLPLNVEVEVMLVVCLIAGAALAAAHDVAPDAAAVAPTAV